MANEVNENAAEPMQELSDVGSLAICDRSPDNYQYWGKFWEAVNIDEPFKGKEAPREDQPNLLMMFQIKSGDAFLLALDASFPAEPPVNPALFDASRCEGVPLPERLPKIRWMVLVVDLENPNADGLIPCAEGYTCSTNCIPYSWATMNRNYHYRVLLKEIQCGGLMTVGIPMIVYQVPSEIGETQSSFLVEIPEFRMANQSPNLEEAIQDTVKQFSEYLENIMIADGISVATQLGPTAFNPQDLIDLGFVREEDIENLKKLQEKQAVEPLDPIGKAFTRGDVIFDKEEDVVYGDVTFDEEDKDK